ncbi:unnamed protein product [Phyllotreta striolata]|uniref:DNA topoisomerase n=1 Tax=Phyllotreta striolata TaxID=444603 RepID=A0A9N9XQE7_PHYSR|nr:unnamed protein product [Phyllotreta striolata]
MLIAVSKSCVSSFKTYLYKCFSTSPKKPTPIMKYLNVAEKNDAAKNIAQILSRGSSDRREGLSPYNKIYEFNANVLNEDVRMVMTSVSGHLLNYEFRGNYKSWQSCNPLSLFDAPIDKHCPENYVKVKKTLEREIRSCEGLIIWTDCDREGENIGFEIIKVCTDIKPNLRIYRAKFSEITGASIFRALRTLGQPNRNVSDAVDVRQELDLRTGAAFTRLQTLRLQKVFPQKLADKLISYGSCQFPTLGFVVERYKAIENFIAEPFWKIKMSHTVEDINTEFLWRRERLFNKAAVEAILDHCKENPLARVESVENKEKSKWRPVPLDTVEMEKNASRKLRINAKDAMQIAERLYTQGYISYPRTETNIFPKELNLTNLVQQHVNDADWGTFAQRILNEGGPTPRQGKKSDQAHPPIHPTKYADNLGGNDKKLYEFIVRHFLACLHKDAKGFETTVKVDIADEKFQAKGLLILEKNYLDVYVYEKWNAKEISNYTADSTFTPTVLEMVESSTAPPKLLTEAELITLMEKHGIGTDATHAEHIDKIKSREYVGLHDNIYFVPGTLGMGLVEGYNNVGLEVSLAKPNLRAEFENDLKLICDGLKDPDVVRREQIGKYKAVFQTVMQKMRLIDESLGNRLDDAPVAVPDAEITAHPDENKPAMKCPKCGRDMFIRRRKNGTGMFLSCSGYPDCRHSIWFPTSIQTIEVQDNHCNKCGPNYKLLKFKFSVNYFPGEPNPNVLCIGGCDMNVLETLDINLSSVRNQGSINNLNITETDSSNARRNSDSGFSTASSRNNASFNHQNTDFNRTNTVANRTAASLPGPSRNNSFTNQNNDFNRTNNSTNGSLSLLPGPSRSSSGNRSNNAEEVVCSCHQNAILLTVRKEGPNQGRQFYKCPNGTCNFFLWAPDSAGNSNTSMNGNQQYQNRNQTNDTDVNCECGTAAVLKTVTKTGPNTGKQFYSCPKPFGQGCNFFKWSNQDNNEGGGGDFGGQPKQKFPKSNKKRPAPSSSNQPRAKRKCGICGVEGHTKTTCPNK